MGDPSRSLAGRDDSSLKAMKPFQLGRRGGVGVRLVALLLPILSLAAVTEAVMDEGKRHSARKSLA
jgi:hypothetical protein